MKGCVNIGVACEKSGKHEKGKYVSGITNWLSALVKNKCYALRDRLDAKLRTIM